MKDIYSRHYTQEKFANFLVSNLDIKGPKKAIDLGAGQASLSNALKYRWKNIKITAFDIDETAVKKLSSYKHINAKQRDCLTFDSLKKFQVLNSKFEVAVCNPPYKDLTIENFRSNLLNSVGLTKTSSLPRITSDIYFFAKNLFSLKKSGVMGIILPDTVMTGKHYKSFREDIVSNLNILGCYQLPTSVFTNTEAQAYILIIKNEKPKSNKIRVGQLNIRAKIIGTKNIKKEAAIDRFDYVFHKRSNKILEGCKTLADLNVKIYRGQINKSVIKNYTDKYFHTTSFKEYKSATLSLNNSPDIFKKSKCKKGDILFARVGSRCLGRVAIVQRGNQYITDCIFRIVVPKERLRDKIFKELASKHGQEWINKHSKGVCAKSISIEELLKFPIPM